MFVFPSLQDDVSQFTGLVSSFWTQIYGGNKLVVDYLTGCMLNQQQLNNDVNELLNTYSRNTCPIFHSEIWYDVDLLQSQLEAGVGVFSFPWPSQVAKVNHALNGLTQPTVALTNGVDFDIANDFITFTFNPFVDERFTPLPVIDHSGAVIDHKIPLWFLNAQLDKATVYKQYGYLTNINLPSSQNYRDLVVAILHAVSGATSYTDIARAASAITDIPLVLSDDETVELVTPDARGLVIVTDKNVYRFTSTATPVVNVGDVVNTDDMLVDALYIFEPNRGGTPNISSITLGPDDMLDASLSGPVTFDNSDTPLVVIPNVSGYTKLTWACGGSFADVSDFFDLLHTKGIAAGKTLAMCMDSRPQPQYSQPTAANLPATINPLAFLFQNVFRNNAFVVRVKWADRGPNALPVDLNTVLRQVLPPHVALLSVEV